MDKGGYLVYKCRKCGKVYHNTHAPLIHVALIDIINGYNFPEGWFGAVREPEKMMFDLHTCSDTNIGVADLMGGIVND